MIIIIDSNYLCHYNAHRFTDFNFKGMQTGVIFGFLHSLYSIVDQVLPSYNDNMGESVQSLKVVFAWDSRESIRRSLYPAYKEGRHKKHKTREERKAEAEMYGQFDAVRDWVLPTIGFRNVFIAPQFEADDIIASICNRYKDRERVVIVSSDNDLYQLLSPGCCMYRPKTKKYYTSKDFRQEWRIQPQQWVLVKAMAGCASDNISGIEGVGEKKAAAYIRGLLPKGGKVAQRIESDEGQTIIATNLPLVALPMPGCPRFTLRKDQLTARGCLKVCEAYVFRSLMAAEVSWRQLFSMKR